MNNYNTYEREGHCDSQVVCIDERRSEFVRTGALYDFKKLLACRRMTRFGFSVFYGFPFGSRFSVIRIAGHAPSQLFSIS